MAKQSKPLDLLSVDESGIFEGVSVSPTGRHIHSTPEHQYLNCHGTITGRWSSSTNLNKSNQPKQVTKATIRAVDFTALESRILASLLKE